MKALALLLKPASPTPSNTGSHSDRSKETLRRDDGSTVMRSSTAKRHRRVHAYETPRVTRAGT